MKQPERYPSRYFIPELIEDEDIIFNKDSEYHKQKKKEKKNPIFISMVQEEPLFKIIN